MTTRVGIWEESTWERPGSRRGGGGVERGGDACIALGGSTLPGLGDASIPSPLHTAPAPTRSRPLPMGFIPNTYPCGRPGDDSARERAISPWTPPNSPHILVA